MKLKIKGGLQMGESMKFTELDQYLFGQGTIMKYIRNWELIRLHIAVERVYILQYGHRMPGLYL